MGNVAEVHCLSHHDIRGYILLDDRGQSLVTVEAVRSNLGEARSIDVIIEDDHGEERDLSDDMLEALRPRVRLGIEEVRKFAGDLPICFTRATSMTEAVSMANWIDL